MKILITGATGQQGGALARALLARGHAVRAFTRKPDGDAARALAGLGAELAPGSFDDASALDAAIRGTAAVFAMGTPFEAGPDVETRQGKALVDAARRAGTDHFVYTSVGSAHKQTGIPHFESKRRVEKHLEAADLPYTILRPVFFSENLFGPGFLPRLRKGTVAMGLPATRKLQHVSIGDIARFAALVLERRDRFLGQAIDLASDELSGQETAAALSRVTGRPFQYAEVPLREIRRFSEDYALMLEWFDEVGYSADIEGLRRDYPEVGWRRFEEWLRGQDLSAALSAA